jgi:hypothetical protein
MTCDRNETKVLSHNCFQSGAQSHFVRLKTIALLQCLLSCLVPLFGDIGLGTGTGMHLHISSSPSSTIAMENDLGGRVIQHTDAIYE